MIVAALLAMLVDMVQGVAPRVSALVTVLLVGTPRVRLVQAQQPLTASHARLGHMSTQQAAPAALTALLVRIWMQ